MTQQEKDKRPKPAPATHTADGGEPNSSPRQSAETARVLAQTRRKILHPAN